MDHNQIDQFDLIDKYLMGKLPSEESVSFEEHFVDCPQCIARLQTTKNFLQDLRFVAAKQASQLNRYEPRRASWLSLPMLFRKPLALAVSCLLIAAVAGTFFVFNYMRVLLTEVNQAKSLAEQLERRYEDERQSAIAADKRHQETELQQTEQLRALETKLKDEEAQRAKMATESGQRTVAEGNLPILVLSSIRGAETNASESVNQITLSRSSSILAFSIVLEGELQFEDYRITIFDDHYRLIYKKGGLTPNGYNSLFFSLKQSHFKPGHYSLTLEGNKKEGGWDIIGNYPFLISKPR